MKTFIIAEVAQNHEGSFNQCFAFIDAIASTGATAVKFQTHIANEESSQKELWRKKFSHLNETRYEYWKRMQFSKEQWRQLKDYAHKKGLLFLSSPFSEKAIDLLQEIGIDAWKVGSGEVVSYSMLDKMIKTQKPIYISSGMSSWDEMDEYIGYLKHKKAKFVLMQCSTSYPTKFSQTGVNAIPKMKERYSCPIGFSDHSGSIYPALLAKSFGAATIEVHITLSKYMFGPDVYSSLDIEQLKELVFAIKAFETMQKPFNKDAFSEKCSTLKNIFYKKAIAKKNISAGQKIKKSDFVFKKDNADGLAELDFREYISCILVKPIKKGETLTKQFFDSKTNSITKRKIDTTRQFYKKRALEHETKGLRDYHS